MSSRADAEARERRSTLEKHVGAGLAGLLLEPAGVHAFRRAASGRAAKSAHAKPLARLPWRQLCCATN
jgi:hypothetical protein